MLFSLSIFFCAQLLPCPFFLKKFFPFSCLLLTLVFKAKGLHFYHGKNNHICNLKVKNSNDVFFYGKQNFHVRGIAEKYKMIIR